MVFVRLKLSISNKQLDRKEVPMVPFFLKDELPLRAFHFLALL